MQIWNGPGPDSNAALQGRVLAALRTWLGEPRLSAELRMLDPGQPPSLHRHERRVVAELPFSWLSEVWAPGWATVFGRFCLTARTSSGARWELLMVGADLGQTERVTVRLAR